MFEPLSITTSDEEAQEKEKKEEKKKEKKKDAYSAVAESTGLSRKQVKEAVEGVFEYAGEEIKKSGSFKIGGYLKLELKDRPATITRKGVNPFTTKPCIFKIKPASKEVKAIPMKKLQEACVYDSA